MNIFLAQSEQQAQLWQEFVDGHTDPSNYHRWGWKHVIENSFGWPTFYLMAEENGRTKGILPLVWQKSWVFGSFVTSLPFLNAGGVLAESPGAKQALIQEAISLTQGLGAKYLELRHRGDSQLGLPTKTNKVGVIVEVEHDEGKAFGSLRQEVRTKIRKAMKSGLAAEICGAEALDDFYEIFATNMRDLGTPVYSKRFFREIFRLFPSDTYLCIVRHQSKAVAASLLTGFRDTVETLCGSSLRKYLPMAPNMLLCWKMLRFTAERGYRIFDFGRSTVGSGPHRFKLQWNSQEVPLHWNYWLVNDGDLPELNPHNPKFRSAIRVWQRLPLALTKVIGPRIVRCLP